MLHCGAYRCRTPLPEKRAPIQSRYVTTSFVGCWSQITFPCLTVLPGGCFHAWRPDTFVDMSSAHSDEGGLPNSSGDLQRRQHSLGCCGSSHSSPGSEFCHCVAREVLKRASAMVRLPTGPVQWQKMRIRARQVHCMEFVYCAQDSKICNAGNGSNWTFGGHVECDASVMTGDGAFGAVGAVSGTCKRAHCQCVPQ